MLEAVRAALGDRYEIGTELGRGGMAVVYAATDRRHHRPVAIKVLLPGIAAVLGVDRFLREIETTARLTHPHIVPVFDSGALDLGGPGGRTPFFVMPLVPGASLRERLRAEPQLPLEEALAICRDVGGALAYAHAQGVIHRDVKPENILLSSGQALLTDFGIARPADPREREALTTTGLVMGTPGYMSPEQRMGDAALDGRCDQYALAAVLYEMLAGEAPFAGPTPQSVAARQLAGETRSLRIVRPGLPPAVDATVRQALSPAPADRFPTVAAFLAALSAPAPAARMPGRRRRQALVAAAVAIGAAAVWLLSRPEPASDGRLGVALMPFRTTGERAAEWGEALPDLLATTLSGTPGIRVPDPWSLWRGLRPGQGDRAVSPDLREADALARRVRADRFVLGSLVQDGARLELAMRIYRTGAAEPLAVLSLSEPADSAVALARRAAVDLMLRLAPQGRAAPGDPAPATRSPEALKAYLEAREAFRRGQVDSADAAIGRAIALDSLFALALIEAVSVRTWAQSMRGVPFGGLRALLDRALPLAEGLPDRHRLRLLAMDASVATDGPRAAAAFRRIIELDSTDVEAWNGLAYVSLVYGWQFGVSRDELIEIADRALALDSTYMPALVRRAQLSPLLEDPADARRQVERLRAQEAGSPVLRASRRGLEALLATDAEFAALADSLARAPPIEWVGIIRRLRAYQPDRALALVRRLRQTASPGFAYNIAASAQSSLLAGIGRFRELDSIRASGAWAAVPGLNAQSDWRLLAHATLGLEDSAATAGALARVTAMFPRDSALAGMERTAVWLGSWLLASYHATRGEAAEARAWLETMRDFPRRGSPLEWAAAERADIESRLAARAGLADSAAALAQRAFDLWTIHTENVQDIDPEPTLRFRLAEAIRDRGLLDSAAVLFGSLTPPTTWVGGVTTRALYELGLIAERQGDRRRALAHFDHALRYWELGGPEVAGWRERAREGVRRNAEGR